ncbi:tetraacyldisaccharide 4'-kinase [Spirosoma sp. BT702]|uniref:Tetraacyldisaccharide 4'-kinase n=1 Tax=Spirosoma profusum TaxID=2771354 RepID=A0A926Y0C8_9BACT|nr:tetraacyldisaccharide 4'-kinase [Spirosoma profusum]MBD2704259.1 tetraacyldisaccharide 4'-kinase [Spirosoma profusum]
MKYFKGKWLLLPASWLYGGITDIRNWLYDSQLIRSLRPSLPTISVGNLTVGGTGKTPMIEFLIKRSLSPTLNVPKRIVSLSRGYGRQTKGFRVATDADTAATIGDEPLQLYRKFGQAIQVTVGERRADAILTIQDRFPETKQILLDDAFQHRAVQPKLNILLMDYNRPFYEDYPFPAGRLRERRNSARRADGIVVTKCPANLWETEQQRITSQIRTYCRPETPVFFAGLQYEDPVSFATKQTVTSLPPVVLVSGLARAEPLEQYVRQTYQLIHHERFADHYAYTRNDLDKLITALPSGAALLTTEKDWVKLDTLLTTDERSALPLYFLPVAMQFLPGQDSAFTQFLERAKE